MPRVVTRPTKHLAVWGTERATSIASSLIEHSIPFSFMPLPDDGYQIDVPAEHETILLDAAQCFPEADYGPMTLKYEVDNEAVAVPAGTVLTPHHFADGQYLCSHFDVLIWIDMADFDVMPISMMAD